MCDIYVLYIYLINYSLPHTITEGEEFLDVFLETCCFNLRPRGLRKIRS